MKVYGTVKVQLHQFLTSALDEGEWSALRTSHYGPGQNAYSWNRHVDGFQNWFGHFGKEKNFLPPLKTEQWFRRHPSCSLITTPTAISQLQRQ